MDHYAVFGNPISHSLSPVIHQLFAAQTQQSLIYTKIFVPLDGFTAAVQAFQNQGGKGFNITLPFKPEAFAIANTVTDRAALAQAVNTISIREDGSRLGDNTDGIGLIRDLKENQQVSLQGKRILILGAGGAVRGILGPLLEQRPQCIVIANRTLTKAQELINSFAHLGTLSATTLVDIEQSAFDIIINSISAGLHGEMPVLTPHIMNKDTFCYDLVYSKTMTPFLSWAQTNRATHFTDGLGMLIEQAAEAFFLWRGVRPETKNIIHQLK